MPYLNRPPISVEGFRIYLYLRDTNAPDYNDRKSKLVTWQKLISYFYDNKSFNNKYFI